MFAEWLLLILLLAGTALAFFSKVKGRGARFAFCTLLLAGILGTSIWAARLRRDQKSRAELSLPHTDRLDEYAGSDSCRACHPNQYSSWHRTFHRTMTQQASSRSVRGNFNDVTLELDGNKYQLERRGEEFWVHMPDPDLTVPQIAGSNRTTSAPSNVWKRVSMVTGSHHMQAYWVDNKHGNQQLSLPFTYLFEQERWVPRRTTFVMDPRDTNWAQVWNLGCINCHSTAGQPAKTNAVSFDTRAAELGIACEACHGPAAKHVKANSSPLRRYRLHFKERGDDLIVNPARLGSKRSSEICGRCHSVHSPLDDRRWEAEGVNYKPGEELETRLRVLTNPHSKELRESTFWNDGMIRVSGREYNGLLKTPCFQRGEMSCLSCHSMHESAPANQLAKQMESNAACLQCHQSFANRIEEHTHHPAGSSGSLCYNCHMPYTSYGLLKALRSHQISSPDVRTSLQTGRPNACNLCHLDKTLDWSAQNLAKWFKKPIPDLPPKEKTIAASILWSLQGDAGQRALLAWHMGWPEARQASKQDWLPPYLALLMQDDYPAVRYIAGRSLSRFPGFESFSYDYLAEDKLKDAAKSIFATWAKASKSAGNPSLLLTKEGVLKQTEVSKLLESQNNRVVYLNE